MLQDLFQSMRVVALPTKSNFRGVKLREVALFKGEFGWGEFSPFLEYDTDECVPWLQSAIAAATKPVPKLFREKIKVNGTIPALNDSAEIEEIVKNKNEERKQTNNNEKAISSFLEKNLNSIKKIAEKEGISISDLIKVLKKSE